MKITSIIAVVVLALAGACALAKERRRQISIRQRLGRYKR